MQAARLAGLRRFVLVTMLGLLAGVALAACQTQPGTAAYVGDTRFTDEQVEQMATAVEADVVRANPEAKGQVHFGNLRQTLVRLKVFDELAGRYAQEQHIDIPARDYATAAQRIGLPADDPYVQLSADADAYQTALLAKAQRIDPTEADVREVYDTIVKSGVNVGDYESVRQQILALPGLPEGLGLRAALADAAKRYGVGVSPRYTPLDVPVAAVTTGSGSSVPIVTLPLGTPPGSPAVQDVR
jgi:hypothetical protein